MPRQKLSEYRAKVIVTEALGLPYAGWPIDAEADIEDQLHKINAEISTFVVKVDQGVKGRFKKGLVALNVAPQELAEAVNTLKSEGYRWLIVEPMVAHEQAAERYLSISVERSGISLRCTMQGGVNVEDQADTIQTVELNEETNWDDLSEQTGFSVQQLRRLFQAFTDNYFVFIEINPYVVAESGLLLLDAAIEVDDAGEFFVDSWQADDFRVFSGQQQTSEEAVVQELDANSPASLKLSVLEPNGSIFLLLSGGGASVVVADEVYNQGFGEQLANYGEYSGNPNAEETHIYTQQLLSLLLKSSAPKKILFIGGAVANFTDIAKTFAGVIKAIDEVADELQAADVKVFVRRGGPNQEAGLATMKTALEKYGLLGAVYSPATPLTAVVDEALQELKV